MGESAKGSEQKSFVPKEFEVDEDITLRTLRPKDADRIMEIVHSDTDIRNHYVTWLAGAESVDDIADRIRGFNQNRSLRYGIYFDGELAGYIGAFRTEAQEQVNEFDLGYFCDPDYRGKGLVSRSLQAMLDQLKSKLGAESFALYIADENTASKAVADKAGFERTSTTKYDELLNKHEVRYQKLASDI